MDGVVHNGRCLCGAVKFTVVPVNSEIGACHCATCRHWTTGPFMGIDCGDTFNAASDDHLAIYDSSDWAERGFCRQCGTSLFYRLKESGAAYVSVHAIENLKGISLHDEVFIDEKPDYYSFAQKTKQMTGEELFALFADEGN